MSDWAETFGKLRKQFVELSEERLKRMEDLLAGLEELPYQPALLEELGRHFHSLKGAGGSYGFQKVTQTSRKAQEECQALLEKDAKPTAGDLNHWRDAVVALKMELASPPQDMGTPDQPGTGLA